VNAATSRLQQHYKQAVISSLMQEYAYKSIMQVPGLVKITLNVGAGEATTNPKVLDSAIEELTRITGQRPRITRARKSIAAFKLREGNAIGVMVTLRRQRMWNFLDRLISVALPQVRDFRGLPRRGFDGHGNYTLGIREQIIFPEISYDDIEQIRGMNITIHTTAETDAEGLRLLELVGMPFRAN
jgi:large subunit ribosomal protein L5